MTDDIKPLCSSDLGAPYPLYPGEILTELDPKGRGEFPDPHRFPPPPGEQGRCGCLMVTYPKDAGCYDGGVRLECIWQPWWDTVIVSPSAGQSISFFQGGKDTDVFRNGRRQPAQDGRTNLETPGSMTWPKRFHLWEIELVFSRGVQPFVDDQYFSKITESMVFTFRIGEKNHFKLPLNMFYRRERKVNAYYAPFPLPLFLPSVQNFIGVLDIPDTLYHRALEDSHGRYLPEKEHSFMVRCALNGYLSREIP